MIVDHAIKCINRSDHSGVVHSWYGVFENGNLVDCVYDYEAAKVIVHNRKDQWIDHGK